MREGNSVSSGDKANGSQSKEVPSLPELSNGTAKSDLEKDSPSAPLRQNSCEKVPGTPHEASRESSTSESSPPSKPGSASSSAHHSNPPPEINLEEDAPTLTKDLLQKPLQRRKGHSDKEWTFYPSHCHHTYHTGKKCVFDGLHLRTRTSTSERTLEMRTGKKKYVAEIDSRNGIPMVTPGDHPYACPEQSRDFHKMGSMVPPVNFGSATYKKKVDTFIPLEHLPGHPCVPFHIKEKQQELEREKLEVKNLDFWKPSPMLLQTLFATVPGRRMTYQPY